MADTEPIHTRLVEADRSHLGVVGGVVLQQLVGPRIPHLERERGWGREGHTHQVIR